MKPFKSEAALLDAKREFISGADKPNEINIFSLSGINKLSEDDILNRIEDIDSQSCLLRWRLWYAMRKKYPSDREFGQRIADLKTTRAICASGPSVINREMHAGRWCEEHKIDDLNAIGILKSVIYILSAPANKDVSSAIYKEIKRKNLPIKEVERLISQHRAVLTIEKQTDIQAPVEMDYDKPEGEKRFISVEKGIAQIPEVLDQKSEEVEKVIDHDNPIVPISLPQFLGDIKVYSLDEKKSYNEQFCKLNDVIAQEVVTHEHAEVRLSDFSDEDLLLEFATRKADNLSDKEIVAELMIIMERYDKSFSELAEISKLLEKACRKMCS